MSKQIYIDSDGNEIQVSGTVNSADMMPMSGNDSTKVSEAIADLQTGKADKASLASILAPTNRLTSSHNMNSVDVGTYYQSDVSMPTNAPSGGYNGYIVVCKVRATDRIQFWYSINTSKLYYRSTASWSNGSSSSWSNWATITAS